MLWAKLIMLSVLHAVSAHADPNIYPKAFDFNFSGANDNSTHLYRMHMQSPRQLLSWFRCQWLWGCSVPTSTMKFIHQCHHRTSVIGSYTDSYEVPITPSSYTSQKAHIYLHFTSTWQNTVFFIFAHTAFCWILLYRGDLWTSTFSACITLHSCVLGGHIL